MNRIAILKNVVKEYAWGSTTFLPDLLGNEAPEERPQAELWMGAHPNGPSLVAWDGAWIPFSVLLEKDPVGVLGKSVAATFSNRLPFLFKVLAAAKPLSIQAHPDLEQAKEGFTRENSLEVPPDSPLRNYRDQSHKPEILCAVAPFWALKGLRKAEEILALAEKVALPALDDLMRPLKQASPPGGIKRFLESLLTLRREDRAKLLSKAVYAIERQALTHPAFVWIARLHHAFPGDAGALSPLFMNLLCLQPGEAVYIPPGELHAYLEGPAIELMANSDNVLRGGLTTKHVSVSELLRILDCSPGEVEILKAISKGGPERIYPAPAREFALSSILLEEESSYRSACDRSVEIVICMEGNALLSDLGSPEGFPMKKGTAVIIPAAVRQYAIRGKATLYKAAVPL